MSERLKTWDYDMCPHCRGDISKRRNQAKLDSWLNGVYVGLSIANDKLKELNLRIETPSKENVFKEYEELKLTNVRSSQQVVSKEGGQDERVS